MSSFCGVPENLEGVADGGMSQWARGHEITWTIGRAIPGFSPDQSRDIIQSAFELWVAVCGVRHRYTPNSSANVIVATQSIDGRNGVLAQAQLPQRNQRAGSLGLWFDTSEVWVLAQNPPPGKMDVLRVACHELGHSLGMGHAPAQSPNLMAPSVSTIREPQPGWDIPQSVARYGDTASTPTDPPGGPGDDRDQLARLIAELLRQCSDSRVRRVLEGWQQR